MRITVMVMIALAMAWQLMCGSDDVQAVYSEVTRDLISMRKEFPVAQPKIYKLLDQVDKLFKQAKAVQAERDELRKKLLERQVELREQLEASKKSFEMAKLELTKKLEEQQRKAQSVEQERDRLATKVATLETKEANKSRSMLAKKDDVKKELGEEKV